MSDQYDSILDWISALKNPKVQQGVFALVLAALLCAFVAVFAVREPPRYSPRQLANCRSKGNVVSVLKRDTPAEAWPNDADTHGLYGQDALPKVDDAVDLQIDNGTAAWSTQDSSVVACTVVIGVGARSDQMTFKPYQQQAASATMKLGRDTIYVVVLAYDSNRPPGLGEDGLPKS